LKILHIFDHSIPLQDGYAMRSLAILERQRSFGWRTAHLTGPRQGNAPAARETIEGWEFHRTPLPGGLLARLPVLSQLADMRAMRRRLGDLVRVEKPDLLHAHSPALNGWAALGVARRARLPLVYEIRAFWEDAAVASGIEAEGGARYRLTRALESMVVRTADHVVVICEGLRGDLIRRGVPAGRISVVPNGVDGDSFSGASAADPELQRALGLEGKTVLGFLGSFYRFEGLHLLLAAMPALRAAQPRLRLLLVGGGEADAELRRQAEALGLGESVIFTGRVPHKDVQRYYDLVDLLVYPRLPMRLTELVTPLKPLEAMAQDKIVVASDVGGMRELVSDNETGFLFRAGDGESLVRRILDADAARADWPAMRARARHYVATERSWSASIERYRPIYEPLTAAG
jgi:PEP-CTERM/exosortase A-associated glycosyltransferase